MKRPTPRLPFYLSPQPRRWHCRQVVRLLQTRKKPGIRWSTSSRHRRNAGTPPGPSWFPDAYASFYPDLANTNKHHTEPSLRLTA